MTWWNGPLLALDLESTSTDPEEARIVSAALVFFDGAREYSRCWLADPGVEISEEATAVHGITTERVRAEGRPASDVILEIMHTIMRRPLGTPLVAFRSPYDLTVVDREARRYLRAELPECLVIDSSVLDKHLDRYRKGLRTLAATCEHYGVELGDAHDAKADALATVRLARVVGARGQVVRKVWDGQTGAEKAALVHHWESVRGDLKLLHAAQRTWYEDSMRGLAQHFEEKGEPKTISTDWPLIPAKVLA